MPRMELSEAEANLVREYRRKTEIDRTHNAALDLAAEIADREISKMIPHATFLAQLEPGIGTEVQTAALILTVKESILRHTRELP